MFKDHEEVFECTGLLAESVAKLFSAAKQVRPSAGSRRSWPFNSELLFSSLPLPQFTHPNHVTSYHITHNRQGVVGVPLMTFDHHHVVTIDLVPPISSPSPKLLSQRQVTHFVGSFNSPGMTPCRREQSYFKCLPPDRVVC